MALKVPGRVLAYMRANAEALMTGTCTIEAKAAARGEYGEPLEVYEVLESNVPCRIITVGFRLDTAASSQGEREVIPDAYRLVCPAGTALAVDQRITVSDGTRWHVVDLVTRRTDETDTQAVIARDQ